MTEFRA